MRKFLTFLRQPELHLFVFVVALILFSRPKLLMSNAELPGTVVTAFFLPWAIVIFILFVVSRGYSEPAVTESRESADSVDSAEPSSSGPEKVE